ncbi:MAG: PspC domain-containing protein [Clostridia bacterium]|nr:PspC domain-containing protein [Clostridia bacterium]
MPCTSAKKLTKGSDKKLAGVCSGLANYFGIDPTIVRLVFALFTLFIGYGVMTYIVCLIMMPSDPVQVVTDNKYEN